jgi:membrane peptidoglycan carboxypeptidase
VGSFHTYQIIRRRRHGFRSSGGEANRLLPAWAIVTIFLAIISLSALFVQAGLLFTAITRDLPSIERIGIWLDRENGTLLEPTRFYDRSGNTVLFTLGNPGIDRKMLAVDPSQPDHFSPQLTRAWVAMQQRDFWSSNGIDTSDILNPKPITIAEKLAANLLLENELEGKKKAVRMRLLASQMVRNYGSSQVLEWYLNSANFGHQAYGVESASQLYFGKSAADLDLFEAAMLVVISESPALNPIDAPSHIDVLHKEALNRLLLAGLIGSEEYIRRAASTPEFAQVPTSGLSNYSAFIEVVRDQLEDEIGQETLERGGLNVITTLDMELQSQVACTLRTQLERMQAPDSPVVSAADCPAGRLLPRLESQTGSDIVYLRAEGAILDPQTGEVLAMLGELGSDGLITSATSHEPGSLVTPFVGISAFARGYSPASLLWDIPDEGVDPTSISRNPDGDFHGPVSLRAALANDYLAPISRIYEEIGSQTLAQLWIPFGLGQVSSTEPETSMLERGGFWTLLQAARAYGILAAGGQSHGVTTGSGEVVEPKIIRAVEDNQGSLIPATPAEESQQVLSEPLAYLINHVLSDESARERSMGRPNPFEIGRPAGGKIGRTADDNSLWAVGYTPQRLAITWFGQDSTEGSLPLDIRAATGITHALLQYAVRTIPEENWRQPAGISEVSVCDPSGKLPTRDCPAIVKEVFLTGSEPTSADTMYQRLSVNRETGRLATVFTPPEQQIEKVFLVVPVEYRSWAEKAGFDIAPTEYDTIQVSTVNPDVYIASPAGFAYIRGRTQILGTARGADFDQYRLEIGQGVNPGEWFQIGGGKSTVENGVLGEWDTIGREGLHTVRLIVVDTDQEFRTAVMQVAVDNTPPEIRITNPQQAETLEIEAGNPITLRAEASDNIGINRVEWWLNNVRIDSRGQPPFALPWSPESGEHTLVVRAFDLAGNMGESEPVEFTVE